MNSALFPLRMIGVNEVCDVTGTCRSKLYEDRKNGLLTRPIHISQRRVAWPHFEIQQIVAARVAGYADDQIRELVKALENDRRTLIQQLSIPIVGSRNSTGVACLCAAQQAALSNPSSASTDGKRGRS
jgi:predicted DNA-binding transcriptional regulator AlpA